MDSLDNEIKELEGSKRHEPSQVLWNTNDRFVLIDNDVLDSLFKDRRFDLDEGIINASGRFIRELVGGFGRAALVHFDNQPE